MTSERLGDRPAIVEAVANWALWRDTGRWDKISKKSKPVGFAFELAGDSPADRIPPAGTWLGHKGPPYLLKGD